MEHSIYILYCFDNDKYHYLLDRYTKESIIQNYNELSKQHLFLYYDLVKFSEDELNQKDIIRCCLNYIDKLNNKLK